MSEEIAFGDVFLFVVCVIGLCVFYFYIIVPVVDHQNFVNQAPKITKEIDVTNMQTYNNILSIYLIIDSDGNEYIVNTFDDSKIDINVGHTHNITYYCNENNNRVIISAVDISPKPVDRLKCVNMSGRCE